MFRLTRKLKPMLTVGICRDNKDATMSPERKTSFPESNWRYLLRSPYWGCNFYLGTFGFRFYGSRINITDNKIVIIKNENSWVVETSDDPSNIEYCAYERG